MCLLPLGQAVAGSGIAIKAAAFDALGLQDGQTPRDKLPGDRSVPNVAIVAFLQSAASLWALLLLEMRLC